jgi:hypothetical protein
MVDKEKQQLTTMVPGSNPGELVEIRLPIGRGIAGYVASSGNTLNIPDGNPIVRLRLMFSLSRLSLQQGSGQKNWL